MSFNLKQINFRWGQRPFVALCLSFCLAFSGPVFALETGSTPIVTQPKPGKPIIPTKKDGEETKLPPDAIPSTLGSMQALVIPEAFGTIKEIFQGSQKETFVFHIQDVHASFEVQQNIAKIIDHINRTYFQDQIDLIAVEGAKGDVDLSLLKSVPDQEALQKTTHYLMQEALMTGAEYYSTFYQKRAEVFGIEEGALYFDNLQAFRDTVRQAESTQPLFEQFENSFYQLLDQMASPELKELYEKEAAYTNNKLSLSQFCLYLKELTQKYKLNAEIHPNFKTVLEAIALEKKMNFKQLEKEQAQLIQALQRLRVNEVTSALIQKGLDYRTGKISAAQYYAFLLDLGQAKGLEPKQNYAELYQYNRLVQLQTQIKASVLFKEIDWLCDEIKAKMLTSKEETELDKIKEGFELLNDLRQLKLTRSQWQQFAQEKDDFDLNEWLDFMVAQANQRGLQLTPPSDLAALKTMLAAPERFYQDALARDQVIAENLFKELKSSNKKVAILITGGFHTEGLTQQIKAKEISYAVITPRMTEKYDDALYLQRMMGEKAALAMPVNWPNKLLEESNVPEELRNEVAQWVYTTVIIALGLFKEFDVDKKYQEAAQKVVEQKIGMRWIEQENQFYVEYISADGKSVRRTVKNFPLPDRPIYLAVSEPREIPKETGPAAFQGKLAENQIEKYGVQELNVLSIKGNVKVIKGEEAQGAQALKQAIRQNGKYISLKEGINFVVDNDLIQALEAAGLKLEPLITQALNRAEDRTTLINQLQGRELFLVLFDRSKNVAEDHLGNGVIGLNPALTDILKEQKGEKTQLIFTTVFQVAVVHELSHEAKPVKGFQDAANIDRFEAEQVALDTALFFALASQAGLTPDLSTWATLASLFDVGSPFLVQPVSRIARAFALAKKNQDIQAALNEVGADLVLVGGDPDSKEVRAFSALGGLETIIQALQYPAVILDVNRLKDPRQRDEFKIYMDRLTESLKDRKRPEKIRIYVTGLAFEEELQMKLTEVGLDQDRVTPVVIARQADESETSYAQKIAEEVKKNREQDLRFFVSAENEKFYDQVTRLIGLVTTLFANSEKVEIRMTQVEYDLILDALKEMGTEEALAVRRDIESNMIPDGNMRILHLPAETFINSKYMDTLEKARRTLAKQA